MDPETKEHLLKMCEAMQKVVYTNETRIQGTQQALRSLSILVVKIFWESPYMDDFTQLLDEMAGYLDQGSQEPLLLLQILRGMKMHIEGRSENEIAAFLITEERSLQEQKKEILKKIAARKPSIPRPVEMFFLALHIPTGDVH